MQKELDSVFEERLAEVEGHLKRRLSTYERFLLEILPNCDVREFCNHIVVQSLFLRIAELLGVQLKDLSESVKEGALKALREGKPFKAIYTGALKEFRREEENRLGLK